MKTQIVYSVKPLKRELDELKAVFPDLNITLTPLQSEIKASYKYIYNYLTLDWDWFRTLFTTDNVIKCLYLKRDELKKVGISNHIGFYSLDNDNIFDFYIAHTDKLDKRAVANGFKSNFAWVFVHEFLHGSVYEETKNDVLSNNLVHEWEAKGELKKQLAEYLERRKAKLQTKVSLLTQLLNLLTLKKKIEETPSNPNKLQPLVERKANEVIKSMELLGMPMRIVQGYRSIEEQNKLYAQGRTTPGNIVTNAKGGESFHNYGVAVDFVFRKEGYNATEAQWKTFGAVGKQHGFDWGGDWTSFVDKPHLQMTLNYKLSDFQKGKVDYSKYK